MLGSGGPPQWKALQPGALPRGDSLFERHAAEPRKGFESHGANGDLAAQLLQGDQEMASFFTLVSLVNSIKCIFYSIPMYILLKRKKTSEVVDCRMDR